MVHVFPDHQPVSRPVEHRVELGDVRVEQLAGADEHQDVGHAADVPKERAHAIVVHVVGARPVAPADRQPRNRQPGVLVGIGRDVRALHRRVHPWGHHDQLVGHADLFLLEVLGQGERETAARRVAHEDELLSRLFVGLFQVQRHDQVERIRAGTEGNQVVGGRDDQRVGLLDDPLQELPVERREVVLVAAAVDVDDDEV